MCATLVVLLFSVFALVIPSAYALDPLPLTQYALITVDLPEPTTQTFGMTYFTDVNPRGRLLGGFLGLTPTPFLLTLGTPPLPLACDGLQTTAQAVNGMGQVTGACIQADRTVSYLYTPNRSRAFQLMAPSPSTMSAEGMAINDLGGIAGYFYDDTKPGASGFVLRNGRFTRIDVPFAGAQATVVTALSMRWDLGGYYTDAAGGIHGFLRVNGEFTEFNAPEAIYTIPLDVNTKGAIVGLAALNSTAVSFLLTEGQWFAVQVVSPEVMLTDIGGIDNDGQLAGRLVIAGGEDPQAVPALSRGFLAMPLPAAPQEEVARAGGTTRREERLALRALTAPDRPDEPLGAHRLQAALHCTDPDLLPHKLRHWCGR